MIVGMSYLPKGVYGVAQLVIRERSIKRATVPLVQRLIGLQTVNKVRIRSMKISPT